uniref:CW-type domain-containing protein n=1 Tax=Sus scrofa TaxID=9823 RepID=A0A8D2BTK2_PIG
MHVQLFLCKLFLNKVLSNKKKRRGMLEFIHRNIEYMDILRARLQTVLCVLDNEKLQGGFMLCFLDDGCGMSPEEASDIIYFGTSKKRLSALKFIGQYGNGLKSGSMRIGKDFILFTKKEETMTCVFFSQTFCEREGLSEVVVPIPSWLTKTRESVTDNLQKFSTELSIIYKYSPFKTEAELMQQFDVIYGKCGTLLVIYNLKLLLSGEPELDVKTDKEDILMAGALEDFPERWSFRAYTSVLYFDPWMRIFIQAKKVKTKYLCYCLYRPRKYLYVTSSFKETFKNEVKKAEEAVKIGINYCGTYPTLELKKARTLSLFFGVNIENRSQAGMFIYSNNRLIKMHEKVGPQLKLKSLLGAGVVGIVNIPLEIMEPSHNKQEFLNVKEYNHLLKVMGQHLVQYCKDTGISNRNLTLFWNEFGYQNNKDTERSLDSVQYQRRQAMAIPFIIQCDLCLKWRILPPSTDYEEKECFDIWICANNPNLLENSCHQTEHLPSIPLGTMSTVSPSKNEKEKQLQESVQRYQNRLAEQHRQPQFIPTSRITEFTTTSCSLLFKENTKTQRIRPSGNDLKHESLLSFELSDNPRGGKRSTEGSDSDIEYVSETKITKKSMQKKVKPQQWRHPAALLENVKLAKRPQVCVCLCVCELCCDILEIKRNSSSPNWESMPVEDLNPSSGNKARVSVSGGCKVASSLTESSQRASVKETVRKLTSNLREILLYFFPEYQVPSELGHTSLEELIGNSEIQDVYMAQYEKKLKRKMQSIIYDANRRGVVNEVSLVQCEEKRKTTEDKLNNLRIKLAVLLKKLQLGGPAGDLEQIDSYLEVLLKEDNLFQKTENMPQN